MHIYTASFIKISQASLLHIYIYTYAQTLVIFFSLSASSIRHSMHVSDKVIQHDSKRTNRMRVVDAIM
jgi:hypothetical protein